MRLLVFDRLFTNPYFPREKQLGYGVFLFFDGGLSEIRIRNLYLFFFRPLSLLTSIPKKRSCKYTRFFFTGNE